MKIFRYLSLFIFTSFLIGCEDPLENKTNFDWDDSQVWRLPELAEGVLLQAYAAIPVRPDNFSSNFLDCATDNALTTSYNSNVYKASMGGITSVDNPLGNWPLAYQQLQHINSFLENGLTDKVLYNRADANLDKDTKKRLKGEAHFLRAWWHFELLKNYGGKTNNGEALGIIIAKKFINQDEAAQFDKLSRATYQESVNFIVADLNAAMSLLPEVYSGSSSGITGETQIGRANAVAARVLKSRVLLYSASPAYQNDDVLSLDGMGSFTVKNVSAYNQKWINAAIEIDSILAKNGTTFTALTASSFADAPSTTPADFVFRKYFNTSLVESQHFPPYNYGNANTIPSHNLVKAFGTKSGYPQGDSRSGWIGSNPYANLDNRFLLNIYHHGRPFGITNPGALPGTPIDVRQGGKDSPESDIKATRSGYYLAKFISTNHKMLNPISKVSSVHYNPLLRKSEVFLNYAEAANEAWGPKGIGPISKKSAYDIIKEIRAKSGGITDVKYLDEMAANPVLFRKLIQNERRLEFAFENHRYYDLRRSLLPLNEDVYGIVVSTEADNKLVYTEKFLEKRHFDTKHYYSPMPYDEISKNPALVNNLGW
jgi:starch-binding outer membrane protein, SusD/RagB family